jgi:hypothetical protein
VLSFLHEKIENEIAQRKCGWKIQKEDSDGRFRRKIQKEDSKGKIQNQFIVTTNISLNNKNV